jgi:hypothetical protein
MQQRGLGGGAGRRALVEAGIAVISIGGLAAIILLLQPFPSLLGRNVAQAAFLFLPMLAIPAFRNLVEYHAELLYARELTGSRITLLCALTALKAALITWVMTRFAADNGWVIWLNAVFGAIYLVSALATYRLLGRAGR